MTPPLLGHNTSRGVQILRYCARLNCKTRRQCRFRGEIRDKGAGCHAADLHGAGIATGSPAAQHYTCNDDASNSTSVHFYNCTELSSVKRECRLLGGASALLESLHLAEMSHSSIPDLPPGFRSVPTWLFDAHEWHVCRSLCAGGVTPRV